MPSPFKFAKHGQSGHRGQRALSRTSPSCIDDLCVIRSMHTDIPNHEPALLMMNSGQIQPTRPSLGSWLTYGLGHREPEPARLRRPLPGQAGRRPAALEQQLPAGDLPGDAHQQQGDRPQDDHRPRQQPTASARDAQRRQLDLLKRLNEQHLDARGDDDPARRPGSQSLEMAFRMQFEAQEAFDLGQRVAGDPRAATARASSPTPA